MAPIFLQRGGGNWIPLLLLVIGVFAVFKILEWLIHLAIHKFRHRHDPADASCSSGSFENEE